MRKLDSEKVLLLHQYLSESTGGTVGLRDKTLLESAINNCYATFNGEELYPTKEEKAANLCYSLVSNHAFVDGNKRIGVYVMLSFLELNGIHINATNNEIYKLGMNVAKGKMKTTDIATWIISHKK